MFIVALSDADLFVLEGTTERSAEFACKLGLRSRILVNQGRILVGELTLVTAGRPNATLVIAGIGDVCRFIQSNGSVTGYVVRRTPRENVGLIVATTVDATGNRAGFDHNVGAAGHGHTVAAAPMLPASGMLNTR